MNSQLKKILLRVSNSNYELFLDQFKPVYISAFGRTQKSKDANVLLESYKVFFKD